MKQSQCPAERAISSHPRTLQLADLTQPAPMSFQPGKPGGEEVAHELRCELRADHAGSERDHVHVVVLHTLASREGIVAERASHAGELARRDAGAHPAPTGDDAARCLSTD